MELKNVEFKAYAKDLGVLEERLSVLNPILEGVFRQVDTYYNVPLGRVKLREYDDFSSLIYYNRTDGVDAKGSDVIYYKHEKDAALGAILELQFGIKVRVSKVRKVLKYKNVSVHLDTVEGLGTFVEVEACNIGAEQGVDLKKQCDEFFELLKLKEEDLVAVSYSDLILMRNEE
ncbi:class IV adenylate cyclase [Myroides marinus]|uniref:class IV adenylate cyclase n=1 Tax=Myroides marinus TaxID=703342 RepID=UPI0025782A76|nr:class IV adenylate cyclase [Myroides marinus]MDM1380016.1 class IV adenylate cyclase [Myroides marinus]MDM1387327.1 class IV adenylate cyclase [Myroides marinus]MDM1394500.1 class IV adenylate cyclase [Myroides marinus]